MAIQQENRFYIGVAINPDGSILSRSALVSSVVREGLGVYLVTMSEGVGVAEETHSLQMGDSDKTGALASYQRVSDTQFRLRTFDNSGDATDLTVYFNMHRISNSNGL